MEQSPELALQPDGSRYTWGRCLDDVAARHGDRSALGVQSEPGAAWDETSFRELRARARALARGLIGAGVVKGARVAVLMANGPEWVVASFAVGLVGGVLVPVNTFATPAERDYILRHSDASLLLLQGGMAKRNFLAELSERHREIARADPGRLRCPALPHLRRIVCLDAAAVAGLGQTGIETEAELLSLGGDVPDELLDAAAAEVHPADDGVLIYTSGTTAHPKGVLHMQRAPVIQSWRFGEDMALVPEDVVLTAQPFFWTAGIAMSLGASLAVGARLITEPVFDAGRFLALIESERVTALHAWPHQEKAMAEHPDLPGRDLSSLRKIEFASPLAGAAGITRDNWGTYGSYGLSETFTLASSLPASAPAAQRSGTSGRPLPGTALRIVDPDSGVPLERAGEKGEIAVKGLTFMRGYTKVEPELYLDEEGFFRTQDAGSLDADGYLHWSGRLSNVIKTGGANVSPLEIEAALADHEAIRLAAAVGVPHPVLGEVIVLCAVRASGSEIDEEAIREGLRGRLAAYKVPKRVLFLEADELQFTANQKLQLGPLRELVLERLRAEGAEIEGVRYEG
jgi:fatty-acyl-CoA synthase